MLKLNDLSLDKLRKRRDKLSDFIRTQEIELRQSRQYLLELDKEIEKRLAKLE